ncbi:PucR family transcriptional regulator [Nocardia sp. NPDC059195]|uniref:PucR family transcriptional regulator n=1 Tax=Nocardia sp. NPDC059195 TaxID=3346765 RepID=UPI00367BDB77
MTAQLDRQLPDLLRSRTADVIDEIERDFRLRAPGIADTWEAATSWSLHAIIDETITGFLDELTCEPPIWSAATSLYRRLGAELSNQERDLEALQTALQVGGHVACRRFISAAYRHGWTEEVLATLTDRLFALIATAMEAANQGYLRQQGQVVTDRDRHRTSLRNLLIRDREPELEEIHEAARAASWPVPKRIAVMALARNGGRCHAILPPDVLVDWEASTPYLIVPDPGRPHLIRQLVNLTRPRHVAIGPTATVTQGAQSLQWASYAITLIERGILPAGHGLRCVEHAATISASMAEDLMDASARELLGQLAALPPQRAQPLLETLLAYLECGGNALVAGERLGIHSQTVRYRLRRITELMGRPIDDPDRRLDLMSIVNWQCRTIALTEAA